MLCFVQKNSSPVPRGGGEIPSTGVILRTRLPTFSKANHFPAIAASTLLGAAKKKDVRECTSGEKILCMACQWPGQIIFGCLIPIALALLKRAV